MSEKHDREKLCAYTVHVFGHRRSVPREQQVHLSPQVNHLLRYETESTHSTAVNDTQIDRSALSSVEETAQGSSQYRAKITSNQRDDSAAVGTMESRGLPGDWGL